MGVKDFTQYISKLIEKYHVPSIQMGIISNGEIVMNETLGCADVKEGIKATEKSIYSIGSATKSFVAAAAAKLVDEGKLRWDAPVKEYFPDFKMYDKYAQEHLTIRDILCHRSGLPRHDKVWQCGLHDAENLMEAIQYLEPSTSFRSKMQYQNIMYALMGYIIELVSGKEWHTYIKENITDKLGMDDTTFFIEDIKEYDRFAKGYEWDGRELREYENFSFSKESTIGAAGSMCSNIEDLLKWIDFNTTNSKDLGSPIISSEALSQCHRAQVVCDMYDFGFEEITAQSYGFGWFVDIFKGQKVVYHSGTVAGFMCMMAFVPSRKTGFAYLMNSRSNSLLYTLFYTMLDYILEGDYKAWDKRMNDLIQRRMEAYMQNQAKGDSNSREFTKHELSLNMYEGVYDNPAYGGVNIKHKNDQLVMEYLGGVYQLEHKGGNTFTTKDIVNLQTVEIKFVLECKEAVASVKVALEPALPEGIEFVRTRA